MAVGMIWFLEIGNEETKLFKLLSYFSTWDFFLGLFSNGKGILPRNANYTWVLFIKKDKKCSGRKVRIYTSGNILSVLSLRLIDFLVLELIHSVSKTS